MSKAGIFLAEGFEEIEGLTPVDILRRAEISVTMISITGKKEVTGAHGITVAADELAENVDYEQLAGLILPGGMPGAGHLLMSGIVNEQIIKFDRDNKLIAAICAAPMVLGAAGLLKGRKACCYPGFEEELVGADVVRDRVVVDRNIITGRSMGKALAFSFAVVEYFKDANAAAELKKAVIYGHQR